VRESQCVRVFEGVSVVCTEMSLCAAPSLCAHKICTYILTLSLFTLDTLALSLSYVL
jgi:hypothetical protein